MKDASARRHMNATSKPVSLGTCVFFSPPLTEVLRLTDVLTLRYTYRPGDLLWRRQIGDELYG